ncbi:hypothetical protein ON010_g17999 [Phytophthora cinnamomi]|nr:hypothetical protein ON010_g17999 [Phytophthora cinnamomi]
MRTNKLYFNIDKCIRSSVQCASDFAIGCDLLQADAKGRERVVAFESRQLKAAEKDYPVRDNELLAMKYALVKFRVHLLGSQPFVVYTDDASLHTATQSPHLSQRMARWLSCFAEYNFKVKYKSVRQNVPADALSRRPDYQLTHVTTVTSSLPDQIRAVYAKDDTCLTLYSIAVFGSRVSATRTPGVDCLGLRRPIYGLLLERGLCGAWHQAGPVHDGPSADRRSNGARESCRGGHTPLDRSGNWALWTRQDAATPDPRSDI